MFEANALGEPPGVVVLTGLVVGIVWTAIAALVAKRIGRARELVRSPDVVALAMAFANAFLLAGGLVLHLLFDSPDAYLDMAQGDLASGTVGYNATLNLLNEWVLVPLGPDGRQCRHDRLVRDRDVPVTRRG